MDPDFSIEQVDVSGDLRETAHDAMAALDSRGDTRLDFLKKAGMAGGAVMGGGALLTALTPAAAMAAGKGRPAGQAAEQNISPDGGPFQETATAAEILNAVEGTGFLV